MMNNYKELVEALRISYKNKNINEALENLLTAADAIEELVKERNTAVEDLKYLDKQLCTDRGCLTTACNEELCFGCQFGNKWEWRGVKE